MSDGSTFLRDDVYDFVCRDAPIYLGLFDGPLPADEIAPTGYARASIDFAAPTDGEGANEAIIVFPAFTGAGGEFSHVALFDAASGGNRLTTVKALSSPGAWADGVPVAFPLDSIGFRVR